MERVIISDLSLIDLYISAYDDVSWEAGESIAEREYHSCHDCKKEGQCYTVNMQNKLHDKLIEKLIRSEKRFKIVGYFSMCY